MKLFRRRPLPLPPIQVEAVEEWSLLLFAKWTELLDEADARPVPLSAYLAEDHVVHFLAFTRGPAPKGPIGSIQVVRDHLKRLHVHRLIVHPAWRGRGVAQELIRIVDETFEESPLYMVIDDPASMQSIIDQYLLEEANEELPEYVEPLQSGGEVYLRPVDAPGESRDSRPGVAGPRSAARDPEASLNTGRPGRRRRGRRGGRRGGRKEDTAQSPKE